MAMAHLEFRTAWETGFGMALHEGRPRASETLSPTAGSGANPSNTAAAHDGENLAVAVTADSWIAFGETPDANADPRHYLYANERREFSLRAGQKIALRTSGNCPPERPERSDVTTIGSAGQLHRSRMHVSQAVADCTIAEDETWPHSLRSLLLIAASRANAIAMHHQPMFFLISSCARSQD